VQSTIFRSKRLNNSRTSLHGADCFSRARFKRTHAIKSHKQLLLAKRQSAACALFSSAAGCSMLYPNTAEFAFCTNCHSSGACSLLSLPRVSTNTTTAFSIRCAIITALTHRATSARGHAMLVFFAAATHSISHKLVSKQCCELRFLIFGGKFENYREFPQKCHISKALKILIFPPPLDVKCGADCCASGCWKKAELCVMTRLPSAIFDTNMKQKK
jgi:hypothetical protein